MEVMNCISVILYGFLSHCNIEGNICCIDFRWTQFDITVICADAKFNHINEKQCFAKATQDAVLPLALRDNCNRRCNLSVGARVAKVAL